MNAGADLLALGLLVLTVPADQAHALTLRILVAPDRAAPEKAAVVMTEPVDEGVLRTAALNAFVFFVVFQAQSPILRELVVVGSGASLAPAMAKTHGAWRFARVRAPEDGALSRAAVGA